MSDRPDDMSGVTETRVYDSVPDRLPGVGSLEVMSEFGEPDMVPLPAESSDESADRHVVRWLLVGVAVFAVIAVTVAMSSISRPASKPTPKSATTQTFPDAHAQFPYQTASDIVSYADHVAIVTAISQREAPRSEQPEVGAPSDSISRRVTFRVDDVLWSRAGAPAAPTKFTALWWGWLAKGHQQFVMDGTPWVFVGGHYIVPIAYDGKEFSVIQPYAVFRFDRGAVTLEEQHTTLARSLAGASSREIADVFAKAVPDPLAVRYANLLPRDRLNAVIAMRKA